MIRKLEERKNILRITSDIETKEAMFNSDIEKVLQWKNLIYVLTKQLPKEGARNIHCLNEYGEKVWIVEEPQGVKNAANAFVGMSLQNDVLVAVTWQGTTHTIDFETGKVLNSIFTK